MHAGEALDRGAVKADAVGESALKFSRGDRDGLQGTEHVSEPEPDKTNVPLFERAQHEFFLPVHGYHLKRFSRFPRRAGALRRDLALLVSLRYQCVVDRAFPHGYVRMIARGPVDVPQWVTW